MNNQTLDNTVILGAGLTGLSYSYHANKQIPIYEKESCVGGLTRTTSSGNYKFDLAPHLLHFRSKEIKQLVLDTLAIKVEKHVRKARICFEDKIIHYPFELHLNEISETVRNECLAGLDEIDLEIRSQEDNLRTGSFENYAIKAFGPGISENYLLPYNRKIWATDPADMTCEWMRFLPTADLEKIREGAFSANRDQFGYNTEFFYPSGGGIQDVADGFAKNLSNVNLNCEAVKIDLEKKQITFANSELITYDQLISTIPLRNLIGICGDEALKSKADDLVNTRVYVVNVVIKGKVPEGVHWIYFPEPHLRFFRVSLPKNYFEDSAPDGEQIIAVEVSSRSPIDDLKGLADTVIEQLKSISIFTIDEVVYCHTDEIPCAYCIYDDNRTSLVEELTGELRKHDIISTGRYGRWEYSAMEDAIQYGKQLALDCDQNI